MYHTIAQETILFQDLLHNIANQFSLSSFTSVFHVESLSFSDISPSQFLNHILELIPKIFFFIEEANNFKEE
jgi:hypothetical protein